MVEEQEETSVRERIRVLIVKDNTIIHDFYEPVKKSVISSFEDPIMERHNILHWFNLAMDETYRLERYRGDGNPMDGIVIFDGGGEIVFRARYEKYIEYRGGLTGESE